MNNLFKVVAQSPTIQVPSQMEGGQTSKCTLVLQELGGKYENAYAVTLLGNGAQCRFATGDMVAAVLRFTTHEYNGQWYQDVVAKEIVALKK